MRATLGVNVNAAAPPKSQPFVEPMTTGHGISVKQLNTPTERFRNLSKVIWLGRRVLLVVTYIVFRLIWEKDEDASEARRDPSADGSGHAR
jgi:hypothetical protein